MAGIVFVGVDTRASLIHRALPLWEPLLGVRCELRGIDVAPGSADGAYLELVQRLRDDRGLAGAVVTTHKLRLFDAARPCFEWLDPLAVECEEVNAIRRLSDGSLHGWARDPLSVGRVVDRIWPRASGDVVCLGAGGTAVALAHNLRGRSPDLRLAFADPDSRALRRVRRIAGGEVEVHLGSGPWDGLVAGAAPGSLIVNATGLGKDRPGSPATEAVRFPEGSVVWELNYRGELRFLEAAHRQSAARSLAVHDGWSLFCHGWAAGLSAVLGLEDGTGLGERFAAAAAGVRPGASRLPAPSGRSG